MFRKLLYIGLISLALTLFFVISGIKFILSGVDMFGPEKESQTQDFVINDTTKVQFVRYDTIQVKIKKTMPEVKNLDTDSTSKIITDSIK
jgi:hypothetical protein